MYENISILNKKQITVAVTSGGVSITSWVNKWKVRGQDADVTMQLWPSSESQPARMDLTELD